MENDLISRKALIAEYDRVHVGPPGGARKLMEEAPEVEAIPIEHILEYAKLLDESTNLVDKFEAGYVRFVVKRWREEHHGKSD